MVRGTIEHALTAQADIPVRRIARTRTLQAVRASVIRDSRQHHGIVGGIEVRLWPDQARLNRADSDEPTVEKPSWSVNLGKAMECRAEPGERDVERRQVSPGESLRGEV